jgi:hypothetical protein
MVSVVVLVGVQLAFDTITKVIETEVLLAYPDFEKPFHIYIRSSAGCSDYAR